MSNARLRGTHWSFRCVRTSPGIDGRGFGAVVQWSGCAVRVDVANLIGRNICRSCRSFHRCNCGTTLRVRLREMMRVIRCAVTNNLRENFRTAFSCRAECFNREHGRAFAECESVATRIDWSALRGRERLQGIESGKNQMADRVVAAREYTLGLTGVNEMPRMTDGICARSTCVGDNRDGAVKFECFGQIERLSLRLIMTHARWLPAVFLRCLQGLTVIRFAEAHPAAGRSEHERQILYRPPA